MASIEMRFPQAEKKELHDFVDGNLPIKSRVIEESG